MRYISLSVCFVLVLLFSVDAQNIIHGTTVRVSFMAPSIEGNPAHENALRHLTIYLPPGYNSNNRHYPVLYFLHGYAGDDTSTYGYLEMDKLMDTAIAKGMTRPIILVVPDNYTSYKGSFYTNSILTGNWADYIGKDVTQYVDKHYRSIANRKSRGVTGISMGGNGALKMGMLFPDVFSSVYSSSAATLNWSDGINVTLSFFKKISNAKTESDIANDFPSILMVDLARTYSPDLNKPPFFADMPVYYEGDKMIIDSVAYNKWSENFATQMIDSHVSALKSLRAIKMDWGRNDQNPHVPATNLLFSKKLEWYGIKHFAEEFLGGHDDQLGGTEGRFYTDMLPFFNTYLSFSE